MNVTIRPASIDDLQSIWHVNHAAFAGDAEADTGTTDNYIGMVLIVFGLCDAKGQIEVVVQCRVDDFMPSVLQASRFDAADDTVPAVEKEDFHVEVPSSATNPKETS